MADSYKFQSRTVHFYGFQGNRLAGTLDFPQGIEPLEYAIMSHCFTCTRQTLTTARVSRGLAQAGIAVLRFDFSGLGESEGDFASTHFSSMLEDITAAADFLKEHYRAPSLLLGHSMGGTASLAVSQSGARALSSLRAVITLASPASPAHVLHHFGAAMPVLERGEASSIEVAGQSYPVKPSFVEDVRQFSMERQMQGCELPLMAIRAGRDELVEARAAEDILAYTRGERKLYEIEQADHLFSNRAHTSQLLQQLIGWLGR